MKRVSIGLSRLAARRIYDGRPQRAARTVASLGQMQAASQGFEKRDEGLPVSLR